MGRTEHVSLDTTFNANHYDKQERSFNLNFIEVARLTSQLPSVFEAPLVHPASGSIGVSLHELGESRGRADAPVDALSSGSNANRMPSGPLQGSQQSSDRKRNLVFFGIAESPAATHFNKRLEQDYNAVLLPSILWLKSVICMLLFVLALVLVGLMPLLHALVPYSLGSIMSPLSPLYSVILIVFLQRF